MALTATLRVDLQALLTNARDLGTDEDRLAYLKTLALTSGTGADQGDQMWHDQRTLAASANEDLDLSGSLTNAFGTSVVLTKLKMLIVFAASANTNDVEVGRSASNGVPLFKAASDAIIIGPGGIFVWTSPDADGIAVTAATGDLINVANSAGGTSVTYDVIVIGVD